MRIGELAKKTGITAETIRYYEAEGLLTAPPRSTNGYRCYDETHLERLRLIRGCRLLDMNQQEIRAIMNAMVQHPDNCRPINNVFDEHIHHVDQRIAELHNLKRQLVNLRQRCRHPQHEAENCGILHGLQEMPFFTDTLHNTHMG